MCVCVCVCVHVCLCLCIHACVCVLVQEAVLKRCRVNTKTEDHSVPVFSVATHPAVAALSGPGVRTTPERRFVLPQRPIRCGVPIHPRLVLHHGSKQVGEDRLRAC